MNHTSETIKIGQRVTLTGMVGDEADVNVYEVAGVKKWRPGWAQVWLTLAETPNFDDPLDYDGYNSDAIVLIDGEGKLTPVLHDERSSLNFSRFENVSIEEA